MLHAKEGSLGIPNYKTSQLKALKFAGTNHGYFSNFFKNNSTQKINIFYKTTANSGFI